MTDTKPTVSDEVRSSFDLSRFADETATAVVRRVAGLGDRNSPDDWPEAMLVTGKELHLIVSSELAEDDLLSRVRTLEEALTELRLTARLLLQNAYGCAVNHHGNDFHESGPPGWFADSENVIRKVEALLSAQALGGQ